MEPKMKKVKTEDTPRRHEEVEAQQSKKSKDTPQAPKSSEPLRTVLLSFTFEKASAAAIVKLSNELKNHMHFGAGCIPIGRYQSTDYAIHVDAQISNLNERFSHLKLTNVKGFPATFESSRNALQLGRLAVSTHPKGQKSRWTVFLDESKMLWALYAVESGEERIFMEAILDPYDKTWDVAFGACAEQKAVLIGHLEEFQMEDGEPIPNPSIFQLDWTIEPWTNEDKVGQNPTDLSSKRFQSRRNKRRHESEDTEDTDTPSPLVALALLKPLMSPDPIIRLLSIDTSFIKTLPYSPDRKSMHTNKSNFYYVINAVTYGGFCLRMDDMNLRAGIVVGRTLMEAAWCQTLVQALQEMDAKKDNRQSKRFLKTLRSLNDAMSSVCITDPDLNHSDSLSG